MIKSTTGSKVPAKGNRIKPASKKGASLLGSRS
jgi:hypothetical protein